MWNLVVPALASLAGGWLAGEGDRKAGEAQADAANQNVALQRDVYADQRRLARPGYVTGGAAANALAAISGIAPQDYEAAYDSSGPDGLGDDPYAWDPYRAYLEQNPLLLQEYMGNKKAQKFYKTPTDYVKKHLELHPDQRLPTRPTAQPTTSTSATGANALANPMAAFEASPYAKIATSGFRGVDVPAINGAFARGGKVLSGAQSIALDERGKARLGGAFEGYANGLRSLANLNQTATSQVGGAASTYGANAGNAAMAAAEAKGNALKGAYKGWGQGISGAIGAVNDYGKSEWGWA